MRPGTPIRLGTAAILQGQADLFLYQARGVGSISGACPPRRDLPSRDQVVGYAGLLFGLPRSARLVLVAVDLRCRASDFEIPSCGFPVNQSHLRPRLMCMIPITRQGRSQTCSPLEDLLAIKGREVSRGPRTTIDERSTIGISLFVWGE